jgi:voltage-gated potassium channel
MLLKKDNLNLFFSTKIKSKFRHSRLDLSMILISLYFFVWLGFGICYWFIANSTNGEAFIFHNHQEVESRISIFKKNVVNSYVPHNELEDIISNKQYNKNFSRMFVGEKRDKQLLLISDDAIGEYWSRYYKEKLLQQGIYYFSTDFNLDSSFCDSYYEKYFPIKITFYRNKDSKITPQSNIIQISSQKDLSKVTKVQQAYIIFESQFYVDLIKSYSDDLKNVSVINKVLRSPNSKSANFEFIFGNSIVFLDDSIITLQKVINGEYKFPIVDFLYFSAVTITTTGYGDILPNSISIRWLVMFETLIGVFIAGAFVSSIFYRGSN